MKIGKFWRPRFPKIILNTLYAAKVMANTTYTLLKSDYLPKSENEVSRK